MRCSSNSPRCTGCALQAAMGMISISRSTGRISCRRRYEAPVPLSHDTVANNDGVQEQEMPFTVDRWFVAYLMQYGLLRVRCLNFHGWRIADWINKNGTALSDQELNEGRSIDIFSNLLGFEGNKLTNSTILLIVYHNCCL